MEGERFGVGRSSSGIFLAADHMDNRVRRLGTWSRIEEDTRLEAKAFKEDGMDFSLKKQLIDHQRAAAMIDESFEARLKKSLRGRDQMVDEWFAIEMPGEVTEMIPTYGGVVIAIAIKDSKELVLLHTISGLKTKSLHVASAEYMMAAGGRYLYVYHPSLGIIEKFDVPTVEKISDVRVESDTVITLLVMGLRNPRTAFVIYRKKTKKNGLKYGLLNMETGGITPLMPEAKNRGDINSLPYSDLNKDIRASADNNLLHLAMWNLSDQHYYVTLDLARARFKIDDLKGQNGSLLMSSDGEFVFSTSGCIYQRLALLKKMERAWLYGVRDGNFSVQFTAYGDHATRYLFP
ncbi:MAG: hypothetical protein D6820_04035 [Lentisphaerae bacterium]|nr:MAG: hypothetical protein D6820_04035 [Lentisphaerota bacterium]